MRERFRDLPPIQKAAVSISLGILGLSTLLGAWKTGEIATGYLNNYLDSRQTSAGNVQHLPESVPTSHTVFLPVVLASSGTIPSPIPPETSCLEFNIEPGDTVYDRVGGPYSDIYKYQENYSYREVDKSRKFEKWRNYFWMLAHKLQIGYIFQVGPQDWINNPPTEPVNCSPLLTP